MKHFILAVTFSIALLPSLSAQMKSVILEDKPVPKPAMLNTQINTWNEAQQGYKTLTPAGKDFLYWINYSRNNPKGFWDSVVAPILQTFPNLKSSYTESLKKDLYAQPKLPLLKLNSILMGTAINHAQDIAQHQGHPGHVSTDGRTFSDRIKAAGIKYCGGENISLGAVEPILSLVLLYVDYGIPALGHRKALLNPDYVETGIGVSDYGPEGNLFIVQDFSCNQQQ